MRLKKLMSLVLACAMALSLVTVASAQDTEVYYVEDFSGYADLAAFYAGQTTTSWTEGGGYPTDAAMATAMAEAASTANGIYKTVGHNVNPQPTLESGKLSLYGASPGTNSGSGSLTLVPNKIWDYVASEEYTYVISYDRSWNNVRSTDTTSYGGVGGGQIWWTDAARSTAASRAIFYSTRTLTDGVASVIYGASGQVDPNSHRTSMGDITIGTEYKYAVGITKGNASGDYYMPGFTYARDGVVTTGLNGNINGGSIYAANQTKTNIGGFSLHDSNGSNSTIDNIKIYTIKSDDFKVYAETATDVPLNTKSMRIYFSNPVYHGTYAAPVVKEDGVAMAEGTYSVSELKDYVGTVGGEIYSYVDVTFANLKEATTYTVEFPGTITNEIGTALEGKNVATFSTKMPDVKIMPLTVVGAESLVANGELQAVKATLINNTSAPKNVALIYAVYAGDKLADIVYINDSVEDTTDYEVGLKLASAGTVKAFAWDGMTSLKPYTGAQQLTVAAAQ